MRFIVDAQLPSAIPEHSMVRVRRDLTAEGHEIAKDTAGTVVFVYGDGRAYAVELDDATDATTVVTIYADDIAGVAFQ